MIVISSHKYSIVMIVYSHYSVQTKLKANAFYVMHTAQILKILETEQSVPEECLA